MVYCGICGAGNYDQSRFCSNCGNPIQRVQVVEIQLCVDCGKSKITHSSSGLCDRCHILRFCR